MLHYKKINLSRCLDYCKIVILSLIGFWLVILCFIPRPDTFDAKCNSTKVDDWSYIGGEGLMVKFQGSKNIYNIKVTEEDFDLDRMVKNNILDRKTCKVLSNKVK